MIFPFRAAIAAILATSNPAFAQDGRQVVDSSKAPYAAVGRVHNSLGGHCTGVLLTPTIAVTAAHCLYNRRTQRWIRPESIHFLLGYARGEYVYHTVAAAYETGEGFDPGGSRDRLGADWALLTLADPAPSDIAPIRQASVAESAAATLSVTVGFARGRPYLMTIGAPCTASGELVSGVILSDCESPNGTSGGPLIALASGTLSGIQVAFGESGGRPVSVTVPSQAWQPALARLVSAAVDAAAVGRDGTMLGGRTSR